jgi:multicomponent Na+:H+ antiporter subunit D
VIGATTSLADWLVVLPVLLCLGGAAVLVVLRSQLALQPWICLAVLLLVVVCDGVLAQRVLTDGPVAMTMGKWLPPFGISFAADAMGVAFAATAALVGLAVVLSLMTEASATAIRDGLYVLILLLLAGVSGAFLTGDLFNLYVWFEVMLAASFGLMVLGGGPLQLDGAIKYGVLNLLATAMFLAALGLLYGQLGTLNMADIAGAAAKADPLTLTTTAGLLALAFATKAAGFPLNTWLPASYHTPPLAISALLGGVLTKVGVYAVLRVLVMLLPAERATLAPAVGVVAVATMLLGPLSAIGETNLRRAIGFLLIGGIGLALSGALAPEAVEGAVVYALHAMLTITALYLAAGAIEAATGASDMRDMGGLYAASSSLSIVVFILLLAVAGVPPFLGFWPKLLLLQGFFTAGNWGLVFAILLSSLLSLIAAARIWARIFWRRVTQPIHSAGLGGGAILVAGTVMLLSLMPNLLLLFGDAAARGLLDPARYIAAVGLAP